MKSQHLLRSLAGLLPLLALLLAAPNAARSQVTAPGPMKLAHGVRMGSSATPGALAAGLRRAQPTHVAGEAYGSQVDPNMWVTNGEVSAIATSANTIYIGGSFTRVGPNTGSFVGIDAGSGAPVANWPRVAGSVFGSAPDGAGGFYIGGSFTAVAGVPRANLAHIRADMTLDAWNPGANDAVNSLLVANGSTVYACGVFTSIGGQSRNYIAALDAGTGQVHVGPHWPGADGAVYAIAVSGSTVYAGGGFASIGGQSRSDIAALDASTGLATPWNPGASSYVLSLVVRGTTVYAGGYFASIGGQSRSGIAALDSSTGLATSWDPSPSPVYS